MHLGTVTILEPPQGEHFDFTRYKDFLASRLHLVRTTRERIVSVPLNLGNPYWIEDPGFDLDFHVHHMALPAPGGMAELCKLASHIWSIPLDRSRPLWDMTLVENLDSVPGVHPGSFALITKIHHAAIDGVSGAEILGILFETSDRPAKSAEPAKWTGERVPGDLELLARSLGNLVREPVKLAKLLPTALKGAVGAAALNQVKKVELPRDSLLASRAPCRGAYS